MNSKYKVLKYSSNNFEDVEDLVSIEEPLEISLKYKEKNKWIEQTLSITMRTPGNDDDLVRGFLFNEQIVKSINDIDSIICKFYSTSSLYEHCICGRNWSVLNDFIKGCSSPCRWKSDNCYNWKCFL